MHDQPRKTLRDIVSSYGPTILEDPRRCRALMMDFCGEYRGEINLIEMALREGVVDELSTASSRMPRGLVVARLAQRLRDAYYLPDDAAYWAVETCEAALAVRPEPFPPEHAMSSSIAATLYVRPWLSGDDAWQLLGQTPGEVAWPADGEVRLDARIDDDAAVALASDLASVGTVHRLDLSHSPLTDRGLRALLALDGIVALNLSRTTVRDAGLEQLATYSGLQSLELWGVETITNHGIGSFRHSEALERLELGRCSLVTDAGVEQLCGTSRMTYLGLSATGISDGAFALVSAMPALHSLDLSETAVTGRGLDDLSVLRCLQTLDFRGCVNLRPEELLPLRMFSELAELRLARCGLLTDEALVHLRPLVGLRSLDLEGLGVTDAGLLYIMRMMALESLDLGWTSITDQGVVRISSLQGLQVLSLSGTQVTDGGVAHLARLHDLTHLDLSNTALTDAGLRVLGSLPALSSLDLEGTLIRDAGLVHLGALPSLERLYLGGTAITDVGLELLSRVTQLKAIDLTMCTGISRDGVAMLRRGGVVVYL